MTEENLETSIMRLERVLLNGNSMGRKSKIALEMANSEGLVDGHQITGIFYASKNLRNTRTLSYSQYRDLESPDYICLRDDGSIASVPKVLIDEDFSPKGFDSK